MPIVISRAIGNHLDKLSRVGHEREDPRDAPKAGGTHYCICACGVPSFSPLPSSVIESPEKLRSFLYKLVASEKKVEVILSAFSATPAAAYNRYRVAEYHFRSAATPFLRRPVGIAGGPDTPGSFPVAHIYFPSRGGPPQVMNIATPAQPTGTPVNEDVLGTKAFKTLKRKLEPDVWQQIVALADDLQTRQHNTERFYVAELDKADRRYADKVREVAALQSKLESVRVELEALQASTPAWRELRSMGKEGISPELRWDKVAGLSDEVMRALTGLPSAKFIEAFVLWMDADGAITDTPLLSHDKVAHLVEEASELASPPVPEPSAANGFAPPHPSVLQHHIAPHSKGQGGVPRLLSNIGEQSTLHIPLPHFPIP